MPQLLAAAAPVIFGATGSVALVTTAGALTLAGTAVSLGTSLLINAALTRGAKSAANVITTTLQEESEKPTYRFPYGKARISGTPAPCRIVGNNGYCCYIMSSLPSEGEFTLYLDNREVVLTGDPYDFSDGGGAVATNEPFAGRLRVWIGLGDQTTAPEQIVREAPETVARPDLFRSTDAWQGRTVCWIKFGYTSEGASERWTQVPPAAALEGKWTKVYDPRTGLTEWSDTASLCALHAAINSPVSPYQVDSIMLEQFKAKADIDEELVPLKSGDTEKRYAANGVLIWDDAELEDQLMPLYLACAARPVRAGGLLGITAGKWVEPEYTLEDVIGDGFEFTTLDSDNSYTEVRTTYISAARGHEDAELPPYQVPNALTDNGGIPSVFSLTIPMVTSDTQAQRLQKIEAYKLTRQRKLSCIAPPSAVGEVAGGNLTLTAGGGFDRWDGDYEIESINPALSLIGEDGELAMRCPLEIVETSSDIYAWDADTDEVEIEVPIYDAFIAGLVAPEIDQAIVIELNNGGFNGDYIRFYFSFDGAKSNSFEVQYKNTESSTWISGTNVLYEVGETDYEALLGPITLGQSYDVRVRNVWGVYNTNWVEITNVSSEFELNDVVATAGTGIINFTGTAPASANLQNLRAYRTTTPSFSSPTTLGNTGVVSAGSSFDFDFATVSGTAYFWIAPVTTTNLIGEVSGPFERTIL